MQWEGVVEVKSMALHLAVSLEAGESPICVNPYNNAASFS